MAVTTASVSILAVEVQALRIGTKQVSQAVFRQLPVKHPFDQPGELWGTVRYFWKECWHGGSVSYRAIRRESGHDHVVWAHDGTLYRACVYSAYAVKQFLLSEYWGTSCLACDTYRRRTGYLTCERCVTEEEEQRAWLQEIQDDAAAYEGWHAEAIAPLSQLFIAV